MSDKLTASVARLMRAGNEYSEGYVKLRIAVDRLAIYLARILPPGPFNLPEHFVFQAWPSGEYRLEKFDGGGNSVFKLDNTTKSRESLMAFAGEVAQGWFDKVSEQLERESAHINWAAQTVETFQGMRS